MCLKFLLLLAAVSAAHSTQLAKFVIFTKDPLSFIYVHTTDGFIGIGQMGRSQMDSTGILADADLVNDMFMRHVAPLAINRDIGTPADLKNLRQDILYANYKNNGQVFSRALSGLDTAMWEIFAKRANQSVCEFVGKQIGRPCLKRVNFYCTNITRDETPQELLSLIGNLHATYGAKGYKLKIGQTMGRNTDVYPNRTDKVISSMRHTLDEALGFHVRLMVDANGGYEDLEHAKHVSKLLEDNDYYWFEEPVPFWNYELTKEIRDKTHVRIALGENEYREEVIKRAMSEGVIDVVQPDFGYAGGFSPLLEIALLARRLGIEFDPHSPDLSLTEFFSVHLMGAVADPDAMYEYGCTDQSTPTDIFVQNLEVANGATTVPTQSGWGVEVRASWLQHAQKVEYPMRPEVSDVFRLVL